MLEKININTADYNPSKNGGVADKIQKRIFSFGTNLISNNPFFKTINHRSMPSSVLSLYLFNLKELVTQTIPNLHKAVNMAKEMGMDQEFIATLKQKIKEENGHEKWAENDLKKMANGHDPFSELYIVPSMNNFIPYIATVAETTPLNYFVYAYFIEELMVAIGPSVINLITKATGMGSDKLTIISNHIEFDQDHAEAGIVVLEKFLSPLSHEERKKVEETLEKTENFIWEFFSDLNQLIPN